jgi:hypothetical protein
MATLHIKDFPDDFIKIMDEWGQKQLPSLNRRQVITTIVKEWIEQNQQPPIYPESEERLMS